MRVITIRRRGTWRIWRRVWRRRIQRILNRRLWLRSWEIRCRGSRNWLRISKIRKCTCRLRLTRRNRKSSITLPVSPTTNCPSNNWNSNYTIPNRSPPPSPPNSPKTRSITNPWSRTCNNRNQTNWKNSSRINSCWRWSCRRWARRARRGWGCWRRVKAGRGQWRRSWRNWGIRAVWRRRKRFRRFRGWSRRSRNWRNRYNFWIKSNRNCATWIPRNNRRCRITSRKQPNSKRTKNSKSSTSTCKTPWP